MHDEWLEEEFFYSLFFFLGEAAVKIARSFTGAATGVVVWEDRGVWPHESQPSRAPERVEWIRGTGSRRNSQRSNVKVPIILFWLLFCMPCCCIHRENHWCGWNRKMPWRREWPTVKGRTLSVAITCSHAALVHYHQPADFWGDFSCFSSPFAATFGQTHQQGERGI